MEAKQFGQFIAGIRKEKKMTQAELAEKIHVTDKAISRWERGLGFPDIQTLEPLAQVLGISVLELMRSEKKKPTGDMDTTETQYTQKEVAEMLQNADDISKQLKKQDKNANIIAGILVIGVGALAWATKIASLGGGLVLGGLSAAVFVSLWYFFQNIDDEESRRIYGVASAFCLLEYVVSLVNYIWGDRIAEWIPGGIERTGTDFLDIVVSVHDCDDDGWNNPSVSVGKDRKKKRSIKRFFLQELWRRFMFVYALAVSEYHAGTAPEYGNLERGTAIC